MILEGLVTTLGPDGAVNIAPMGPIVDEGLTSFTFRPFRSSTTYANLRDRRQGVLHVTDDVLLVAQGAIGEWREAVPTRPATAVKGAVIVDACRWYEFEVASLDDGRSGRRSRRACCTWAADAITSDSIARSMRCWKRRSLRHGCTSCPHTRWPQSGGDWRFRSRRRLGRASGRRSRCSPDSWESGFRN